MTACLAAVGGISWWAGRPTIACCAWAAAAAILLFGLAHPPLLRPVERGWRRLAETLAWINTRVLLTIVFYLVLAPVGLVRRIAGSDPLERRFDRSAATYWKARPAGPPDPARYERQH